jgi:hypothetical protein
VNWAEKLSFDRWRGDVFILGAGFSRAIDSGMPLMRELTQLLGEVLPRELVDRCRFYPTTLS